MSRRRMRVWRSLSTRQVADALGVKPRVVQLWARQGCPHRIEARRPGHGPLRFDLPEVREWLKAQGMDPRYPLGEALKPVTRSQEGA